MNKIQQLENKLLSTPDDIQLIQQLAQKYEETANFKQAEKSWQKIIQIIPENAVVYYNLATLYSNIGKIKEAIPLFNKAISIAADFPQFYNNLGRAYEKNNNTDGAIRNYEKSITIDNKFADGYYSLGKLYLDTQHNDLAFQYLTFALKLDQTQSRIYYAIGQYFESDYNYLTAKEYYQQAYNIDPDNLQAKLAIHWCDYKLLKPVEHISYNQTNSNQPISPFSSMYLIDDAKTQQLIAIDAFNFLSRGITPYIHNKKSRNNNKIIIGYVSPDFNDHAVGIIMRDTITRHDYNKFNINCYALIQTEDDTQKIIAAAANKYINVENNCAADIAAMIYKDKVDILIDLAGFTKNAKPEIFAHKPAPLQISMCGYPGTMGSDVYDYIISSKIYIPENIAQYYNEKCLYMPKTMDCMFSLPVDIAAISRSELSLPTDKFIFCCLNGEDRFEYKVLSVWVDILKTAVNSVLWLHKSSDYFQQSISQFFHDNGINPERIIFTTPERLSSRFIQTAADLWLDTFVLSGGTANILNCWCGLPSITLAGKTQHSRTGAAILDAANLKNLITYSIEEYKNLAIYYYKNPEKLLAQRQLMLAQRTQAPLFQIDEYVRCFEIDILTHLKGHHSS